MERLTRRSTNGTGVYATPSGEPVEWENNRHNVLQKLAEYEDLEEQGRLVKLPCKVGDTVYEIAGATTHGYGYGWKCLTYEKAYVHETVFNLGRLNDIGKTVFLTESAAEAKLKELRGGE